MRAPSVAHACTIVALAAVAAACGAADPAAPATSVSAATTSPAATVAQPAPPSAPTTSAPATTVAAPTAARAAPVAVRRDPQFGEVLVTRDRRALYTWAPERADRRIHCTGSCAELWPPLLVARGTRVAAHVTGVRGRFGTIRRLDGAVQVTLDRVPLYTYVHEGPDEVRCDDVDGWFVVRVR
jgi:predicted lipoprotein with Yx(FWY)xxD motif